MVEELLSSVAVLIVRVTQFIAQLHSIYECIVRNNAATNTTDEALSINNNNKHKIYRATLDLTELTILYDEAFLPLFHHIHMVKESCVKELKTVEIHSDLRYCL